MDFPSSILSTVWFSTQPLPRAQPPQTEGPCDECANFTFNARPTSFVCVEKNGGRTMTTKELFFFFFFSPSHSPNSCVVLWYNPAFGFNVNLFLELANKSHWMFVLIHHVIIFFDKVYTTHETRAKCVQNTVRVVRLVGSEIDTKFRNCTQFGWVIGWSKLLFFSNRWYITICSLCEYVVSIKLRLFL